MPDVRQLVNNRPTASQRNNRQVVYGYVSLQKPAPTSFTDPLYVLPANVSTDAPWGPFSFPAIHGTLLPIQGDPVVLVIDDNGTPWVTWWGTAEYEAPSGGVPTGVTGQTIIYDDADTPVAAAAAQLSLIAFGADPTGTTDSSTAIQAWLDAVSSAGVTGKAEAGTYLVGTSVGIYDEQTWSLVGDQGCNFQWTGGASSGVGFYFHSCDGAVEGINFTFSNSAYDGNLVEVDWGSHAADCRVHFRQCQFGVQTLQNPRCMLRLNHTIESTFEQCHFFGGTYGIVYGDGNYVIANSIRDCSFNNATTAHIYMNGAPCESLIIDGCTFEPLSTGEGGAILANPSAMGAGTRGFSITNNWFGDVSVNGGNGQINIVPAVACTIANNRFYSGLGVPCITLNSNGAVIINNDFQVTGDSNGNVINASDVAYCILIGNNLGPPTNGFPGGVMVIGDYDTHGVAPTTFPGIIQTLEGAPGGSGETYFESSTELGPIYGYTRGPDVQNTAQVVGYYIPSGGGGELNLVAPAASNGLLQAGPTAGGSPSTVLAWGYGPNTGWYVPAIGFFGTSPVAQQTGTGSATGYAAGTTSGTFHEDDTYTGGVGSTAYTINGIVAALKAYGLLES